MFTLVSVFHFYRLPEWSLMIFVKYDYKQISGSDLADS